MSIEQIKPLPTEILELPPMQDVFYTNEPEEDKAISLGEIMGQNFSQNSLDADKSPTAPAEAEDKVDTLSMIMSHDSPVYQVRIKGPSLDEFSLHPNHETYDVQPNNPLQLNLEKQLPDFDSHKSHNSQGDGSPMWSLNANEIKSEIRALEIPAGSTDRNAYLNSAKV